MSGRNAGSVEIQGKEIQFTDSSLALAKNFGNLPGGNLYLQASAGIDLTGTNVQQLLTCAAVTKN